MTRREANLLLLVFVPRIFSKEEPAKHEKSDDDPDDGQPGSDFIHKALNI